MAQRTAALLGPGKGPKVHVGTAGRLVLSGIKADEYVQLSRILNESEDIVHFFQKDGEYPFEPTHFAQVTYEGKNRGFSALIFLGA